MRRTLSCVFLALSACSSGNVGGVPPGKDGGGAPADGRSADVVAPSCKASSVKGIHVGAFGAGINPLDPLGYPPYAIDGCTLVYLAPATGGQTWGELLRRDLSTGAEARLAPSSEMPRRPSVAGDFVAWEAVVGGASVVRVAQGTTTTTLSGPFDHAGEPRATTDAVAFTAWLGPADTSNTDVYLYLPASRKLVAVATGRGQQRFADVSPTLVAVSDFSEDPTGVFSATEHRNADIVVFDRGTLVKTVRHLPGKQAFPMLSSGSRLGYLDWGLVTPEPKFSAYIVRVGEVTSDPTTDANVKGSGQVQTNTPWVRPSVNGDVIVWVDDSTSTGGLFTRPLDLSRPAVSTLGGQDLLEPVAALTLSVVVTPASGFTLEGVAR